VVVLARGDDIWGVVLARGGDITVVILVGVMIFGW
jgi:hypothetical protein